MILSTATTGPLPTNSHTQTQIGFCPFFCSPFSTKLPRCDGEDKSSTPKTKKNPRHQNQFKAIIYLTAYNPTSKLEIPTTNVNPSPITVGYPLSAPSTNGNSNIILFQPSVNDCPPNNSPNDPSTI